MLVNNQLVASLFVSYHLSKVHVNQLDRLSALSTIDKPLTQRHYYI